MSISINENNFGYNVTKNTDNNKFSKNLNFSRKIVKRKSKYLLNEIKYGKIIKNIPNYDNFFSIIINAENTMLRDCKIENSNIINEFNIISDEIPFISLTYNYTNDLKFIDIIIK